MKNSKSTHENTKYLLLSELSINNEIIENLKEENASILSMLYIDDERHLIKYKKIKPTLRNGTAKLFQFEEVGRSKKIRQENFCDKGGLKKLLKLWKNEFENIGISFYFVVSFNDI